MAEEAAAVAKVEEPAKPAAAAAETEKEKKKKGKGGILGRMWRGIFGGGREDYEKRLQYLSREEDLVHRRMRRRAHTSRKMSTNLIVLSVLLEVVAVVYAIMTTRSLDLTWQMRAVRVLPMFVLPALSSVIYSTLLRFIRMLDCKDQKTLEKLRAERKAKIDELKERTNYYITQQLIQKYDLDPAAKAAAAAVLASKLGADSGLKVYVGDESKVDASGKSKDVQLGQSNGLRSRKPSHTRSHSAGSAMTQLIEEMSNEDRADGQEGEVQSQKMVEHYKGPATSDGGWLARIAALLVGEDPTQCYALICGNCHMHNGLARKEDFVYITYYCPHCHALNGSRLPDEHGSGPSSSSGTPVAPCDGSIASTGSNASSVTGNETRSNLATVEELPTGEGDEKELDGES